MTKEEFIFSTIQPMAEYTFPFLTSIIGVTSVDAGEHVGSGLRAIINGRRAVITACHVAEQAHTYPQKFALSVGYGRAPYLVNGQIQLDRVGDLAVYYLPADFPTDAPDIAFWPEDRLQQSVDRLSTDFLFAHGFPATGSSFHPIVEGIASRSLPYGAMQRLEPGVAHLSPFEFAIEFDPAGLRDVESGSGISLDPLGLSGSPVWRIGISGRSREEWSPKLSLVVGFLTQWRPDDKVLVATSAGRLSEILSRG